MKNNYLYPTLLGAFLALGVLIGSYLNFDTNMPLFVKEQPSKSKVNKLIDYIEYEYVDEVDTDSIVDDVVNNILSKLDPHSVYIPKEELAASEDNMRG